MQAHIADKLLYRHWTSYSDGRCNHLILFDTQTKTYKDLTPGNYSLIFMVGVESPIIFSDSRRSVSYPIMMSIRRLAPMPICGRFL